MDTKDKLTKVLAEYQSLSIAEQIDYDKFFFAFNIQEFGELSHLKSK